MESFGVSPHSRNSWIGSPIENKSSPQESSSKQQRGSNESPLALQLQQAWLQTQLPKRNVPRSLEFLSPLPSPDYSIRPTSFSPHATHSQDSFFDSTRPTSFSRQNSSHSHSHNSSLESVRQCPFSPQPSPRSHSHTSSFETVRPPVRPTSFSHSHSSNSYFDSARRTSFSPQPSPQSHSQNNYYDFVRPTPFSPRPSQQSHSQNSYYESVRPPSFSSQQSPAHSQNSYYESVRPTSFSPQASPQSHSQNSYCDSIRQPSFSPQPSPQSHNSHDSYYDAPTSHSEVGSVSSYAGSQHESEVDSDAMEDDDPMLHYLSDMLMEEDMGGQKCMYVQVSAYQAMTRELAGLISDSIPSTSAVDEGYGSDQDTAVESWVDEILNSNPQEFVNEEGDPAEENFLAEEVSTLAIGETPPQTSSAISPQPQTIPSIPVKSDAALDLDCPYLESEPSISGIDYTNGRSGIESLAELYPLLMQCAQSVIAANDVRVVNKLINDLRQRSSPLGDGGQRMTHYFVEALVARLSGTGAQLYTALSSNRPNASEMLKAYRLFVQCDPLPKIAHYFANTSILNAIENVDRVHIIDYGILYGVQWLCFLQKLAQREGGPPHVRITGIDFAQPGFHKNERVEETGRRLAAKAKQLGVDFEYHAIAGKWENIQPSQLTLRDDETLIVNSMFRLRNLLDETVMAASPRKIVLAKILALNPKLFVMGVVSAGYNSPFFMPRFRETVNHFSALFDAIHSSMPPDSELRRLTEREVLGREIMNIVACEGTERIERAETYRQWQSRSLNAGFKQLPIDPAIVGKAYEVLRKYHRNFGAAQDGNWLLTGWRDRVRHALTTWTAG